MRDDSRDITVIESDSGSSVKWFVYGALLGAGLGILFAPRAGDETRTEIGKRARRLRDTAGDKLDELVDEVQTRSRKIQGVVEEWTEDVAGELRDGSRELRRTASTARDDLERRLADARSRRRAGIDVDSADDDFEVAGDGGFDRANANGDRIG